MISRVVTVGEALAVLRNPPDEPSWLARELILGTGGAEGNVAMALARSGVPVRWIGRVGADAMGRRVARELRAEGVEVRAIQDGEHPTGLLLKDTSADGRTRVVYYRKGSAGSRLSEADVAEEPLDAGTLLHLTGITPALSESARAAAALLLDRAEESGSTVSFDVNHRARLWGAEDAAAVYRAIAARAAVLFASVDEVPLLLPGWQGTDPAAAATALAEAGHGHVVVTAGARGAAALRDGASYIQPAVPVRVVDTVGAGDAFVAGYLARLIAGDDPAAALARGALLGAAACRHPGDWEGAADLDGLDPDIDPDPADPVSR
ncbi:sugar kinase [Lysinimonas soli]|uniref:Sugar kinase n=1 Tax=Lysinimonas soli TaxID=1074233 RepID=A0ABW0NQI0_9MICO